MKRRSLLTFLGAAPLVGRHAHAQRAIPVVGFMNPVSPDTYVFNADAFRERLAEAGFVDGRNVGIEYRRASALGLEPRPSFLALADEVIR